MTWLAAVLVSFRHGRDSLYLAWMCQIMPTTKRRHRSPKAIERYATRRRYEMSVRHEAGGIRVVQRKWLRGDPRRWERRSRDIYPSEASAMTELQFGVLHWTGFYRIH